RLSRNCPYSRYESTRSVVRVYDKTLSGWRYEVGIHEVTWEISDGPLGGYDENGPLGGFSKKVLITATGNQPLDTDLDHVYKMKKPAESDLKNFYYIVTNGVDDFIDDDGDGHDDPDYYNIAPHRRGCWNTRQHKDRDWNDPDATKNSEAKFPDGRYKIKVRAEDIKNKADEEEYEVIVDNFKQTIHAVETGTYYESDVFYTNGANPVVYVRGSEYVANHSYTLYITENLGWEDGDTIDHIKRTVTVSTNAQGEIYPQQIYPNAPQGDYDVIVDYLVSSKFSISA
ncbi:MAG: hypothetical protein QME81_12515, partial [bacterium]|nr:hypothetical protein [bacterium]